MRPSPTGATRVADVMTTGVVAAHEGALFKEIVHALARNKISAVPVVDEQHRVVGVVSESDLLARAFGGPLIRPRRRRLPRRPGARRRAHAATARELMSSPAVVTTPQTSIAVAARRAAAARVRRLPVIDSNGVLVGIVTRSDLLRPFLRSDTAIGEDITNNVIIGSYVLNPLGVTVEVREGVAAVRGQVEREPVKDALLASIRKVSGVIDVDDSHLTYRLDEQLNLPDAIAATLIDSQATRRARAAASRRD